MVCPSTYDYHGKIEAALRAWREADKRLAAMVGAERTDHEAAVRAALPFLRPIDNLQALVRHYAEDRSIDPTRPTVGTVEAWAVAACRAARSQRKLRARTVEEAALWRHFCQLISRAANQAAG